MTLHIVYLAGPDVFLPDAIAIGEAKKAICRTHGLEGLFPLDDAPGPTTTPAEEGHEIFRLCVEMMQRADAVIANMTPFRGPSLDVGTAVEIGFMHALGRPVFGYTNVAEDYADRVAPDGMSVEAFGFGDNLMTEGPMFASGATLVRNTVAPDALFTDLTAFEECVRQAAGH